MPALLETLAAIDKTVKSSDFPEVEFGLNI
jgi:hypothetical protein